MAAQRPCRQPGVKELMIIFDHFLAIFDAKHIYDPANPFARDDKIAKAHSLNPAFVQFMQEEQKVEVSFLPKSES